MKTKAQVMIDIPAVVKRARAHGIEIAISDSPITVVEKLLNGMDEMAKQEVNGKDEIIW